MGWLPLSWHSSNEFLLIGILNVYAWLLWIKTLILYCKSQNNLRTNKPNSKRALEGFPSWGMEAAVCGSECLESTTLCLLKAPGLLEAWLCDMCRHNRTCSQPELGIIWTPGLLCPPLREGPLVTHLTHMSSSLSPRTCEWRRQRIHPFLSARGGSIVPILLILPPSLLQLTKNSLPEMYLLKYWRGVV